MGPCSRTPSGPAVSSDCINRPNRRLHPTNAAASIYLLQRGSHPQKTSTATDLREAFFEPLAHAPAIELPPFYGLNSLLFVIDHKGGDAFVDYSGTEPERNAITGVPQAIASTMTRPNSSGQSMGRSSAPANPRNGCFTSSFTSPMSLTWDAVDLRFEPLRLSPQGTICFDDHPIRLLTG